MPEPPVASFSRLCCLQPCPSSPVGCWLPGWLIHCSSSSFTQQSSCSFFQHPRSHKKRQQAISMAPKSHPPAPHASADRRPVICLGDSHTRGFYGASWLRLLRPQFPHLRFINAGNDGEPSEAIAARLPALMEAHPDPAAVLIFSGSNDCIAQESEQLQAWYKSQFKLTQPCSEQYALDNLEQMLALVQDKAPGAKVIVINLPVMVEDPTHTANQRAHKYSAAVASLIRQKHPDVSMVDFQSACRQHMHQHSPDWQQALEELLQQEKQPAAGDSQVSTSSASSSGSRQQLVLSKYRLAWNMAWSKFLQSMLRQRSWNEISASQGLLLLTDQIHINDTAAGILAELVQPLLQDI